MSQTPRHFIITGVLLALVLLTMPSSTNGKCVDFVVSTIRQAENRANISIIDICNQQESLFTMDNASWLPKWSPLGDSITFLRTINYDDQLYVKSMINDTTTKLSGNLVDVRFPVWSSDGEYITFAGDSEGKGVHQIYIVEKSGANLRQFVTIPGNATYSVWSPDNKYIAFVSHLSESQHQIYVVNSDGSQLTRLVDTENLDDRGYLEDFLTWSPDSSQLLFVKTSEMSSERQIFSIAIESAEINQLTNLGHNGFPLWSLVSNQVVFESTRDGLFQIYTMDPNGTHQVRLTTIGSNRWPAWSPSGEIIAFMSDRDRGDWQIYVMDADGSHQMRISDVRNEFGYRNLDWMPVNSH